MLSPYERCVLLCILQTSEWYQDAPLEQSETIAAKLSHGRPWAPYRSLRDWEADHM
jgi:hypothetical protein